MALASHPVAFCVAAKGACTCCGNVNAEPAYYAAHGARGLAAVARPSSVVRALKWGMLVQHQHRMAAIEARWHDEKPALRGIGSHSDIRTPAKPLRDYSSPALRQPDRPDSPIAESSEWQYPAAGSPRCHPFFPRFRSCAAAVSSCCFSHGSERFERQSTQLRTSSCCSGRHF